MCCPFKLIITESFYGEAQAVCRFCTFHFDISVDQLILLVYLFLSKRKNDYSLTANETKTQMLISLKGFVFVIFFHIEKQNINQHNKTIVAEPSDNITYHR